MSRLSAQARFSRRRLEGLIGELISLTKDLCPDAEIEVRIPGYEEQDALLDIIVPDEKEEEVHEALSQKAHDIFMDTDYHIGYWITERSRATHTAELK